MWAGVAKSGSPAPKPITSSPAAFNALARASIARVADSSIAATRSETVITNAILAHVGKDTERIELPQALRPVDGRFGSGPSKVRQQAIDELARVAPTYLGTSHRQATVRSVVG